MNNIIVKNKTSYEIKAKGYWIISAKNLETGEIFYYSSWQPTASGVLFYLRSDNGKGLYFYKKELIERRIKDA